jgi:hypothetical protein
MRDRNTAHRVQRIANLRPIPVCVSILALQPANEITKIEIKSGQGDGLPPCTVMR